MDERALSRFRERCAALLAGADRPLALAVSGGPDSLALLLLANAAFPGRVIAATVDHRLRAASAAEADMVARVCRDAGVPHTILATSVVPAGEGWQAAARAARYDELGAWAVGAGATALATAHHADDQAETLLMRLIRGGGLGGLAGIRESRQLEGLPGIRLVRPLLGWRKSELEDIVRRAGLEPVADPSNDDPRFDRTHVRALLAREPSLIPDRLAASAHALAEAEEALGWAASQLAGERVVAEECGHRLDVAGLPRELRRRLLAELLPEARGDALVRLLHRLEAGQPGTLGDRLVRPDGDLWHVGPAPTRRNT